MNFVWVKILLLLLLICSNVAMGKTIKVPLTDIFPVKSLDLRCIDAKYELKLPIPERWKINSARLSFSYINSASLLKKNSQLVVRLNGTPLAQMKLDPNAPEGSAEINLPPLLLQAGYNNVTFGVSQHYATQCELPCVPELWTRLKLDQAFIEFDYQLKELPQKISQVASALFDEKSFVDNKVNIITQDRTDKVLSLVGGVASGIGIRFNFQPLEFTSLSQIQENSDNLLIGTKEFVESYLAQYDIEFDVSKPVVKIFPLPTKVYDEENGDYFRADKRHALIVISGITEKEIRLAADSFDILSLPFPDSSKMELYEFEIPDIKLYSGKNTLGTGVDYPFSKMDFTTHTFRGFAGSNKQINFRLPPDFLIKPNQYVKVKLNFAYGAGSRLDSVLNVLLNEKYIASIHLDDPRGGLISNYEIDLPTYLFKGGANSLSFQPVMTPLITENCSFVHTENLFLTLFDNSNLHFPDMPHQITMPRLDLMFVNGFPYTRWPDGYQAKIYIPQVNDQTVAAALNIMGLLGQKNGYPLLSMEITSTLPQKYDGELIVIGKISDLPKKLAEIAPLSVGEQYRVPYPVFKSSDDENTVAISTQDSEISLQKGILMQFQSPDVLGRSIVMLTAKSDETVEKLSQAVTRGGVQSNIKGDLVLIDFIQDENAEPESTKFNYATTAIKVGKSYITGKGGKISPIESIMVNNPNLYWGLIFGLIIIFAWLFYWILNRRRINRQNQAQ
ncbi:cellulose biosynthesis cyclic di-GMP-binding regulatory protein BcsB [Pseudoalteromonas denitrificans]|uniref:Cyclic di-GMP-binding protein n=1 Tax=Pseudoalteromonas denitrificans DSM 6059 TaxID=1123010 RepID=A0A1I1LS53_9GAMM|nr:cellulose biosynthesis cyclic di-GMP-binding regulatory protein BcsB [Pseudoalteromonas denitrificans]SFC72290.1 cellulose synthase subunit [Pseudoalteromonas denitrificans DSM 6059]